MTSTRFLSIGGQALPLVPPSAGIDAAEKGVADIEMTLSPITFDFVYRDIRMRGRCVPGERDATLRVVGDIGPLPFTAESPDGRSALWTIIEDANLLFEDPAAAGPFRVTDGRVMLVMERPLTLPVSAVGLVAGIAALLIPIRPYLDLMAEIIRPPLQPVRPGESPLRPEWRRRPARPQAAVRRGGMAAPLPVAKDDGAEETAL